MRDPASLAWAFILCHGLVWTLIPAVSQPNGPLDLIELLDWARHPAAWGYWKHPPLPVWVAEFFVQMAGERLWGAYLASQVAISACFVAVWRFARSFLDPACALLSVLLLEGVMYYNYMTPQFNHGVLEMPIWAWTSFLLWRALNAGTMRYWLLCGLMAGLGLLTRYTLAFLLIPLLAFMLLNAQARKYLATPGPYVALAVATLTFAPHVIWLVEKDFTPIAYALASATRRRTYIPYLDHLVRPLAFALGQALVLAPVFIMMGTLASGTRLKEREAAGGGIARGFLFTVTLGPFLAYLVVSMITGVSVELRWGVAIWSFVGVFILFHLRPALTGPALRRFKFAFSGFAAFWLIAFVGKYTFLPALSGRVTHGLFPGEAIADFVTAQWVKRHGRPLPIVAGDQWLAQNVGFYSPDRPEVYVELDPVKSPWTDDEEFKRRGGVIIWNADKDGAALPERWRARFSHMSVQPGISFARHSSSRVPHVNVGWAFVAPSHETLRDE